MKQKVLKHVQGCIPFHYFAIDLKNLIEKRKNKIYEFIKEKNLLRYKYQFDLIATIINTHDQYSLLVDPIGENKRNLNGNESDIKKITEWEITLYILDVLPKEDHPIEYYNSTDEMIEISLGSGTLQEIKTLLNQIGFTLPEIE